MDSDPAQLFKPVEVKVCTSYFSSSTCSAGEACQYEHMKKDELEMIGFDLRTYPLPFFYGTIKRKCYYFVKGRCRFNERCRFLHGDPLRSEPSGEQATTPSSSSSSGNSNEPEQRTSPTIPASLGAVPRPRRNSPPRNVMPEVMPAAEKKSYAETLSANVEENCETMALCPYFSVEDVCPLLFSNRECPYIHGEPCDICNCSVLHPYNDELRRKHRQNCLQNIEEDMERSFAVQRSADKVCGICYEVVKDRTREKRFGILPNCNHCFCLSCIRQWRQEKEFETDIIRSCPECRVKSDFVCPSPYWVDDKVEKEKVIEKYKTSMAKKACKYYKQGEGHCPFGNKCFYLHANASGDKVDVGPPPNRAKRQTLWDFVQERETLSLDFELNVDEDDLDDFFRDSDDSDEEFLFYY